MVCATRAIAAFRGLAYVRNVQEVLIRGRGDIPFGASSGAVQRGTDVFLGVTQLGQRHPKGGAVFQMVEVGRIMETIALVFAGS